MQSVFLAFFYSFFRKIVKKLISYFLAKFKVSLKCTFSDYSSKCIFIKEFFQVSQSNLAKKWGVFWPLIVLKRSPNIRTELRNSKNIPFRPKNRTSNLSNIELLVPRLIFDQNDSTILPARRGNKMWVNETRVLLGRFVTVRVRMFCSI